MVDVDTMRPSSIVIVDDDRTVAQLLGFMFAREGFAPVLLHDGRAAEEYVVKHDAPAAVLLDVMLPYRDGFSVAAAIRSDARWREVPIVMLTAKSLHSDLGQARQLAVTEYLVKPFQPRAVLDLVKKLLQARAA
jgi:DNA-binding response OmpR family regulator